MGKKIKSFLLLLGLIASMVGCGSSHQRLELHETVVLLKEPGLKNLYIPEMQVAKLPAGSVLIVLDQEYGKDYLAYKVETEEGLKGYVLD